MTEPLTTRQLLLRPATLALLEAELGGPSALARGLEAEVPPDWPPGEYDRAALEFFHAALAERGASGIGWYAWYALAPDSGAGRPVLVGAGGYFGPPDSAGTVEIGYSILPAWRGRGFATELVGALLTRARASGQVRTIRAHTRPDNEPSIRVLERNGFVRGGPGIELGTVRYECQVMAQAAVQHGA